MPGSTWKLFFPVLIPYLQWYCGPSWPYRRLLFWFAPFLLPLRVYHIAWVTETVGRCTVEILLQMHSWLNELAHGEDSKKVDCNLPWQWGDVLVVDVWAMLSHGTQDGRDGSALLVVFSCWVWQVPKGGWYCRVQENQGNLERPLDVSEFCEFLRVLAKALTVQQLWHLHAEKHVALFCF